jgi:hypothetical protein
MDDTTQSRLVTLGIIGVLSLPLWASAIVAFLTRRPIPRRGRFILLCATISYGVICLFPVAIAIGSFVKVLFVPNEPSWVISGSEAREIIVLVLSCLIVVVPSFIVPLRVARSWAAVQAVRR